MYVNSAVPHNKNQSLSLRKVHLNLCAESGPRQVSKDGVAMDALRQGFNTRCYVYAVLFRLQNN